VILSKTSRNFHALVIGVGNEEDNLKKIINKAECSHLISFIPRLSHKEIMSVFHSANIYVSMNKLGNLSNVNLEAIQSDCCMILPKINSNCIDNFTRQILKDSVCYCEPDNPEMLAKKMREILKSKKIEISYKEKLKDYKQDFLISWDERMLKEIQLLENINK